jgi:hypothetical protein
VAGALCHRLVAVTGFTHESLRGLVAAHLGHDDSHGQMNRRLRVTASSNASPKSNTYVLTDEGIRVRGLLHQAPKPPPATVVDANQPPAKIGS